MPSTLQVPAAELAAEYDAGATLEQLASKYGVSPSTIRNRLRVAAVRLRCPGRRPGTRFARWLLSGQQNGPRYV